MPSVHSLARFQLLRPATPACRRAPRPPLPHHRRAFAQTASAHRSGGAFDETADVLVVGAGAAGLLAALRCHHHGLRPLVVEKADKIGGAAAYSGGCVWVPNNHLQEPNGFQDSPSLALRYLDNLIGDVGPASSPERRRAFLENAPRMAEFLRDIGFKWRLGHTYPDYHPDVPGGLEAGRTLEGDVFDLKLLREGRQLINRNPSAPPTPPVHSFQAGRMARMMASLGDFVFGMKIMLRWARHLLLGRDPVTFGMSLVGQMMLLNQQKRTDIWLQTPLRELLTDPSGAVTGAVVSRDGKDVRIQAKHGVVLAAGGFAKNQAMREEYHPHPINCEWSSAPPSDTGDAVQAGIRLNAATALMDDAWWGPTMMIPGLGPYFAMWDRHLPHSVCVDGSGQRFMNEAQSYVDAGRDQFKRNAVATAIPTWYIVDSNYQRRYLLALNPPFCSPEAGVKSGLFIKADTIEDLARQTGIDEAELQKTLHRFNGFAQTGVDEDFGRGDSAFDRCMGDPKHKPNPCLGSIERPPFYAMKLYPGDLGTKGGLLTDEHGRVLDKECQPIRGLYASGNTTASVMGHRYPGAGATLGPALTFSYIGINHIASARKA
ncbi:putative 3-oxosteroid 1-dehydrogenase protein [Neofusicoccum parvum]|nr:putative 3-oxosteroid 1-dehydrogenase protein [Neofusicoccum parvum]